MLKSKYEYLPAIRAAIIWKGRVKMKKLFALMLSAVLLLAFAACGSQPKPADTVKTFCEAMKSFDFSTFSNLNSNIPRASHICTIDFNKSLHNMNSKLTPKPLFLKD